MSNDKIYNVVAIQLYNVKENDTPFAIYKFMAQCFEKSVKKYLKDVDEIIIFGNDINTMNEMFADVPTKLYEIYKRKKCNLLFAGCDQLFIKPTEIFGKYDCFSLFWCEKLIGNNLKNDKFYPLYYNNEYSFEVPGKPYIFMNGPGYFPHNMDEDVWKKCFSHLNLWNFFDKKYKNDSFKKNWGWDMSIYSIMLYSQKQIIDKNVEELIDPLIGFQYPLKDIIYNKYKINPEDAKLIHFHSTRKKFDIFIDFYRKYVSDD